MIFVKEELWRIFKFEWQRREAHIPLWKIAQMVGISEPTLTRWLRVELSQEKKVRILQAIEQLKREAMSA